VVRASMFIRRQKNEVNEGFSHNGVCKF